MKRLRLPKTNNKPQLSAIWNILLILLFSTVITVICFSLQPNSITEVVSAVRKTNPIFIYNLIPVLLSVVIIFLLTNNVFYSAAIISTLFEIASVINRYKILYRDDPFVPIDIAVGAEALSIMTKTNMKISIGLLLALILQIIGLFAIGYFVKSRRVKLSYRTVALAICIIAALASNKYIFKSSKIYWELPTKGPKYYITGNFNSKGFIYCFFYNLNTYKIQAPAKYNIDYAETLEKKYQLKTQKVPKIKPHIIMIMNEAFSDVIVKDLIYTNKNDPLKNFKRISQEGLSGYITVSSFGGGTANTEFDVLTGCMTQNLNKTMASSFRFVRKDFNSLPRFFSSYGYRTQFIHPGQSWFYNRENVYKYLGISEHVFAERFIKPIDYKGSLVSDDAVVNKIIQQYKNHLNTNKQTPFLNFTVTIQNHMPYDNNKYGWQQIEQIKTKVPISDTAYEILSCYVTGLKDADRSLGKLVEFLSIRQEPFVLVFFGDHLPNLGPNYLAYKELGVKINQNGTIYEKFNTHKVPFVIWANDEAKRSINFSNTIKNLYIPKDKTISANYMGAMLYQILGYEGVEPFYDFLNDMRQDIPVILADSYKIGSRCITELPENLEGKMLDYRIWQHYKIKSEEIN